MKSFIKHNFLILLILFFGYSAGQLVFGSTYSRPGGSTQYVGGQKAVGPTVDADFNAIANWLNGANIDATNITPLSISTALLANQAVTFAKLQASNIVVTASSSAFTAASVSPVLVTGLSTTITTTGRPVRVSLEGSPTQYLLGGSLTYGSLVSPHGVLGDMQALFFVRDGSTTAHYPIPTTITGGNQGNYPCSSFGYTEYSLGAGSHTFSVYVSSASALNDVMEVYNCRLVVREEL